MSEIIRIPLGNPPTAYALVDPDDADRIGAHRWTMSGGYAIRSALVDGQRRTVFMHRDVLGLTDADLTVDHINRNPIDNRRSNLRIVTLAENNQNIPPREFNGGSVYRGIHPTVSGKWHAIVRGKRVGTFSTELAAARAAEAYRREHMPFAEPDPRLSILPPERKAA